MKIIDVDHFTLRVPPDMLPVVRDFYQRVLQLRCGARPAFAFSGYWLYAGERAIVHLTGNAPAPGPGQPQQLPTGRLDHVSLRSSGLQSTRAHLAAQGLSWREASVPGAPLHQLFLHDPVGLKIELTFDAAELAQAGPAPQPAAY